MKIGGLDIPAELVEAQDQGELVIYAGAGVSMAPPANLPSFEQLAMDIGKELGEPYEVGEPPEKYLDNLCEKGLSVHETAKRILSRTTDPNQLHTDILRLFPDQTKVRLITTNLDLLFVNAAESLGWETSSIYHAPALPLGRDFNGISHLHGSVKTHHKNLILTQTDFGNAYITDGYSRRFILDIFLNYTVLFIGYSHKDLIMDYLSRGLKGREVKNRYAFVHDEEDKWENLGIKTIKYSLVEGEKQHKSLHDAISIWSDLVQAKPQELKREIREQVSYPAPKLEPETNIIGYALRKEETARYFTGLAKDSSWLEWADSHGYLERLFTPGAKLNKIDRLLAEWFTRNFMLGEYIDTEQAFLTITKNGQKLQSDFHYGLAVHLWWEYQNRKKEGEEQLPNIYIARWIGVICTHLDYIGEHLTWLLSDLDIKELLPTFLVLFEYLTRPKLILSENLWFEDDGETPRRLTDTRVDLPQTEKYLLKDAYEKQVKPNMDLLAEPLLPIICEHIVQAHHLFLLFEKGDEFSDPESWRRWSVEENHPRDEIRSSFSILVDIGREILTWYCWEYPDRGKAIINQWADTDVPLLRRLAIYGMAYHPEMEPDTKINWLIEKGWLCQYLFETEVLLLLKESFPEASPDTQKSTIENLKLCEIYKDRLDNVVSIIEGKTPEIIAHTPDAGWVIPKSPYNVEELLKQDPTDRDFLAFLRDFRSEGFDRPDRSGLEIALGNASSTNPSWGIQLLENLILQNCFKEDLGRGILNGLEKADISYDGWESLLKLIKGRKELTEVHYTVSRLLRDSMNTEQVTIPEKLHGLAEQATKALWDTLNKSTEAVSAVISKSVGGEDVTPEYWRGDINTGTNLAEFWLRMISNERRRLGDTWEEIPGKYKERLEEILSQGSEIALNAKVMLGWNLDFLMTIDSEWTAQVVLPWMDFTDEHMPSSVWIWIGHLWGRASSELLDEMREDYPKAFDRITKNLQNERRKLSRRVAVICVYYHKNPFENNWLTKFLRQAEDDDRGHFASEVGRLLSGASSEFVQAQWSKWIREYIKKRASNAPTPPSKDELLGMASWLVPMKDHFDEAVEQLTRVNLGEKAKYTEAPSSGHFLKNLKESSRVESNPERMANLLKWLLTNKLITQWGLGELSELASQLVGVDGIEPTLSEIHDLLSSQGYDNEI